MSSANPKSKLELLVLRQLPFILFANTFFEFLPVESSPVSKPSGQNLANKRGPRLLEIIRLPRMCARKLVSRSKKNTRSTPQLFPSGGFLGNFNPLPLPQRSRLRSGRGRDESRGGQAPLVGGKAEGMGIKGLGNTRLPFFIPVASSAFWYIFSVVAYHNFGPLPAISPFPRLSVLSLSKLHSKIPLFPSIVRK